MNAADVVGYTYEGEFYCPDCFDDGGDCDDDEVGVVFADSEWDPYPTCTTCGEQCEDVSLTTGGERAQKAWTWLLFSLVGNAVRR